MSTVKKVNAVGKLKFDVVGDGYSIFISRALIEDINLFPNREATLYIEEHKLTKEQMEKLGIE